MTMMTNKCFFHVDDGGASYYLVARDLDHAKQLLRDSGVEFCDEDGESHPIDAPEVGAVAWSELTLEAASKRRVWLGDSGAGPAAMLSECEIGDWFTSEI